MQITVRATHTIEVQPELAQVSLRVTHQDVDQTRCLGRVHEALAQLRPLLEAGTGAGGSVHVDQLQTSSWESGDGQPRQHQASASMTLTTTELDLLSPTLGEAARVDGATIDWIDWQAEEQTLAAARREAITGAVAAARERALSMAGASGLDGVELVELADSGLLSGGAAPSEVALGGAARAFKSASPSVDLDPSPIVVHESVDARFEAR